MHRTFTYMLLKKIDSIYSSIGVAPRWTASYMGEEMFRKKKTPATNESSLNSSLNCLFSACDFINFH